jgi:hypothetical protein
MSGFGPSSGSKSGREVGGELGCEEEGYTISRGFPKPEMNGARKHSTAELFITFLETSWHRQRRLLALFYARWFLGRLLALQASMTKGIL